MGRILLLILIIVAVILLWKAFGPGTWNRQKQAQPQQPAIKGPDDDEDFLWRLEKDAFTQRREKEAQERAAQEAQERAAQEEQERQRKREGRQRPEDEES